MVSAGQRTSLDRRLGTTEAMFIGLGAMVGAGVFVVFAPAAAAAGTTVANARPFCNCLFNRKEPI